MLIQVFGVLALVVSCLLIGNEDYDVTSFRVSQLPFGRQLSEDVCRIIHAVNNVIVSDDRTSIALNMPDFYLINGVDISNLMPLIEREFGVNVTSVTEISGFVDNGFSICTCVTKVVLGSHNDIITVIGKLDGLKYDLRTVKVYHNDSDNPTIPIIHLLTTRVVVIFFAVILGIKCIFC